MYVYRQVKCNVHEQEYYNKNYWIFFLLNIISLRQTVNINKVKLNLYIDGGVKSLKSSHDWERRLWDVYLIIATPLYIFAASLI